MIAFVLGAATGYVLGARAGRERYEQIARTYHKIADHPTVQNAAGTAKEKVTDAVRSKIRPNHNGRLETRPGSTPPVTTTPRTPETYGTEETYGTQDAIRKSNL